MVNVFDRVFVFVERRKTHLATWGLEPASPVSVDRHAMY